MPTVTERTPILTDHKNIEGAVSHTGGWMHRGEEISLTSDAITVLYDRTEVKVVPFKNRGMTGYILQSSI